MQNSKQLTLIVEYPFTIDVPTVEQPQKQSKIRIFALLQLFKKTPEPDYAAMHYRMDCGDQIHQRCVNEAQRLANLLRSKGVPAVAEGKRITLKANNSGEVETLREYMHSKVEVAFTIKEVPNESDDTLQNSDIIIDV